MKFNFRNAKGKLGALLTVPALAGALFASGSSASASAYTTKFTTSVTYQNVGTGDATITFNFYPQNSSNVVSVDPLNGSKLPANAGSSLFLGNVNSVSSGFTGSAQVSADQPIVATMVQLDLTSAVRNRPLSNGFAADAGSTTYLIPTVLKNQFGNLTNTKFSVQNVSSGAVDIYVNFYAVGSATATKTAKYTGVPANSAQYVDAGADATGLPSPFNGSAVITSTGNIVASALELTANGNDASSFEGVPTGASKVYMPTALCNAFGGQNAFYAIQNVETDPSKTATVTITYSDGNKDTKTIAPGAKASVNNCDKFTSGSSGSAVLESTGGNIVAIGKVAGIGLYTAFVGATSGSAKLAVPYVRYTQTRFDTNANNRQRTFLAIQNVGSDLAAGAVTVNYYNPSGALVGTQSLGAIVNGAKVNSNATTATPATGFTAADLAEFGYFGTTIGGSAVVQGPAGSQLVVVARVTSSAGSTNQVGEDYNGIAIQ